MFIRTTTASKPKLPYSVTHSGREHEGDGTGREELAPEFRRLDVHPPTLSRFPADRLPPPITFLSLLYPEMPLLAAASRENVLTVNGGTEE